jgi:transposase
VLLSRELARRSYVARYRELLSLTTEQRDELRRWAQSRTLPAGDVFRARLILALADGATYGAIKQSLRTTAPTISRWKQRFEEFGMDGLEPRHKGSRPRTATPTVQAKLCRKVQQKPRDGSTHWSVRKLSAEMGVSKSSVHRILSQARLQPHRLERYMASNDPEFETKAADIIGLYLEPRSTQPCFAWMRRRPFRLWIASIRCCRFRPGERNGMDSNITGMERCRCMRRWM